MSSQTANAQTLENNPLLKKSDLPYQLPDFANIKTEHYLPAIKAGVAEARAVYAEVAKVSEPTFANVITKLAAPSDTLQRATNVFYNISSAHATADVEALEAEVSEIMTELRNELLLNPDIFERVAHVYAQREKHDLNSEQITLLEKTYQDFVLSGAQLDIQDRQELAALNLEIAAAETAFAQQVLKDLNAASVLVTDEQELSGLSDAQKASLKDAAKQIGRQDAWLITFELPTMQQILSELDDRKLRERIWRASTDRGRENWNKAADIAALRAKKAALLGFADFASYAVADRTAKTPEAVDALFAKTSGPAMRNADREAAKISDAAATDGIMQLQPWDWSYYAARVEKQEYAVDKAKLKEYFELERVLVDGVFYAANRLYGLTFKEREDLAGYHPEVRVWEVFDHDGSGIGLFLGDFFTRDTKNGGAWMNNLVDQSHIDNAKPVVVNNLNIVKPAAGKPALVNYDEVNTLFHEFGHALHGLLSNVQYRTLSGTWVEQDIVEYPSQVNEMWMLHPEILPNYAKHYATGEVVPKELVQAVKSAEIWGEGFRTVEYLRAAVLDWSWHRLPANKNAQAVADPEAFEREVLEKAGLWHELVESRYRTSYLNHSFAGGYESGYYSYLWAEVFDADTVAWYEKSGGLQRANGDKFREYILAIGGSKSIPQSFAEMTGQEARIEPLLRRRGLS